MGEVAVRRVRYGNRPHASIDRQLEYGTAGEMKLFLALEWMMLNGKNAPFLREDCFGTRLSVSRLVASIRCQPVRWTGLSKRYWGRIMPVLRGEGNASLSFDVGVVVFLPRHRWIAVLLCITLRTLHQHRFISYRMRVLSLVLLILGWCSEALAETVQDNRSLPNLEKKISGYLQ